MNLWVQNVDRTETTVTLKFYTGVRCDLCVLPFTIERGSQIDAQLLAQHLACEMENGLSEIRRKAYEQGHKDGRARRRAKKNFCVTWNPVNVGW